jgi:hypothetical protein
LKRGALILALAGLCVFEVGLVAGFLPYEWRREIHRASQRIIPAKIHEPHPDMGWEFELHYRRHPLQKVVIYILQFALTIFIAYLISKVWQRLHQRKAIE